MLEDRNRVRSIAYTGENSDADDLRIIAIRRGVRLGDVVRCACDLALGKPVAVNFFAPAVSNSVQYTENETLHKETA